MDLFVHRTSSILASSHKQRRTYERTGFSCRITCKSLAQPELYSALVRQPGVKCWHADYESGSTSHCRPYPRCHSNTNGTSCDGRVSSELAVWPVCWCVGRSHAPQTSADLG